MRAPLFELLTSLYTSQPSSYHVPGHKYGQSLSLLKGTIDEQALQAYQAIMQLDVTELSMTDDLHGPSGVIEEAQQLAAATFGAEQTFFLVGGSTAGNLAMVLAVCDSNDLIIVQRNAHKSVLNGLKLAGARAVFIMPQKEAGSGLDVVPSLEQIEEALIRYPESKAVFLTNPSYYGLSVDLEPYVELVHRYGKMLLVDEAHGAHYGLHERFPRSALQVGADAVVQSTHKTLTALTMGAMLHIQGPRIDRNSLAEALHMVQSSSPSYPIMASLDVARAVIDSTGEQLFERGIAAADDFRRWVTEESAQYELASSLLREGNQLNAHVDPLRVVLRSKTGRQSGFELLKQLESFGCYAEMADIHYVVLLFGMGAESSDMERLKHALMAIAKEAAETADEPLQIIDAAAYSQLVSEPVLFSRRGAAAGVNAIEAVELSEAEGRLAAEAVIPYPPGIPLLYEGERISAGAIAMIQRLVQHGARCQGASDQTMRTITVLRTG
ncbi:arginine/lysine/ornithine decarboxylase [Paenibacillus taihuensis]|uniref:Arginine/lysine/ornithine decarboxylase n=1 Tax=Paenibacillus taihuensis TaxID=1156355 RepID=A0A3D9QZN2_9BACL|nr:aminotransferase class I/II-fold pyridoxal phosphate-dependent enzyme [Paenibacillus taihuensis]REE66522.1 arginine/lysine/ornithine decarboxylase [Paenibacillus taihuensis]